MPPLPYFDGAHAELRPEFVGPEADAALARFMSQTPADRAADARHVVAYYRDVLDTVGGGYWNDATLGGPFDESTIWDHVTPRAVWVDEDDEGACMSSSRPDACGRTSTA